jgi:hypothetical protein
MLPERTRSWGPQEVGEGGIWEGWPLRAVCSPLEYGKLGRSRRGDAGGEEQRRSSLVRHFAFMSCALAGLG